MSERDRVVWIQVEFCLFSSRKRFLIRILRWFRASYERADLGKEGTEIERRTADDTETPGK